MDQKQQTSYVHVFAWLRISIFVDDDVYVRVNVAASIYDTDSIASPKPGVVEAKLSGRAPSPSCA